MVEFTLGADRAAMGQYNVFSNRQSQSGPSGFTGTRLVHTIEALE